MNQVQVTFRNMPASDAIETLVNEKAAWLQRYFPRVQSCRVVVETGSHRQGRPAVYHVRVDVTVPGSELVASHDPAATPHEDAYTAVRDAFDIMRRQLQAHVQKLRGDVKHHEEAEPVAPSTPPAPEEPELSRPPRSRTG